MDSFWAAIIGVVSYTLFSIYGGLKKTRDDSFAWHGCMGIVCIVCSFWIALSIFPDLASAVIYSAVTYFFAQGVDHIRCSFVKYSSQNRRDGA